MRPKIIAIAGKSGSGKTTLLEKIIPILKNRGHRLGTVKHAHKEVEIDKKGKDSWRHRQAGAHATLVVSPDTIALVKDRETASLRELTPYLSDMDLVIVEGFKQERIPKIEIFRTDSGHKKPLCLDDPDLAAFMTDSHHTTDVPTFGLDEVEALADFIEATFILTEDIPLNQESTH
ncbi:MAG: molybdopterin-guanine dinucleotide biosynthesis protein B [Desulfobacterium sp.]|nr:molybdopterin-guanine dinucleotide biosynthesis protein B [Desulfobacterium sp.]